MITMRYGIILACVVLAGCVRVPPTPTVAQADAMSETVGGLERRIERFSKPDAYGVVCYQDKNNARNLSCVKVQP